MYKKRGKFKIELVFSPFQEQALAQGWAKANKLVGRNASQGLVGVLIIDKSASMVELNCETDFVARNKQFLTLLNEISDVNLSSNAPSAGSEEGISIKNTSKEELLNMTTSNGK